MYDGEEYYTYTLDLTTKNLSFFWKDSEGKRFGSIQSLKIWLEKQGKTLLFATNAGMYAIDRSPKGLYVESNKEVVKLDLNEGDGNFYLKPNGIFAILTNNTATVIESNNYFNIKPSNIFFATQSGPLLLNNFTIHKDIKKESSHKNIRSGVGIINEKTIVFAISNK